MPLDGKAGKGLKKPLAIPQKRTLSGIGKDRDRANEWWNSIFTAGAKNLNIGPVKVSTVTNATAPTKSNPAPPVATIDDKAAADSTEPEAKPPKTGWSMGPRSVMMSLSSLAKREHARKTLMSNFVRGEIIASKEPSPEPVIQIKRLARPEFVEASDLEVEAVLSSEAAKFKKSKRSTEERLEKRLDKGKRRRDRAGHTEPTAAASGSKKQDLAKDFKKTASKAPQSGSADMPKVLKKTPKHSGAQADSNSASIPTTSTDNNVGDRQVPILAESVKKRKKKDKIERHATKTLASEGKEHKEDVSVGTTVVVKSKKRKRKKGKDELQKEKKTKRKHKDSAS